MNSDNGILALIPGDTVGGCSSELPPAGADQVGQPEHQVVTFVPGVGSVRITYRLSSYRHGKSRHRHWVAERAERIEPLHDDQ